MTPQEMTSTNDIAWNWEYLKTLGYIEGLDGFPIKEEIKEQDNSGLTLQLTPEALDSLKEIIKEQDEENNTDNAHYFDHNPS